MQTKQFLTKSVKLKGETMEIGWFEHEMRGFLPKSVTQTVESMQID